MKGKGGSAKRHHIRRTVVEEARKANLKKDLGKTIIKEKYDPKTRIKYF